MIISPRRRPLSPRVTRHFESTRLQDQLIALAYHLLIPVVSRHLGRPRSRSDHNESAHTTIQGRRSKASGA